MSLTESDLHELYRRAQLAFNSGYTVARGDDYAALLGGSDGSPAGLIQLCEGALPPSSEGGEDPSTLPSTPALPTETPKAEPEPEPEPQASVEEAPVSAPAESAPVDGAPVLATPLEQILDEVGAEEEEATSDGPDYEGWSRKQLVVEAEAKGVEVKSSMSKGDIIAALRAAAAS